MSLFRPIDNALIEQVRDRIVAAFRPEALYLFGSAARGETHAESDLDLLIVMDLPDGATAYGKASEVYGLFWGLGVPMDVIVQTPEEFERQSKWLSSISRVAKEEGVLLYSNYERATVE